MSLTLKKDPAKRLGGWALVRLPEGAAGQTMVCVRRADTEEWLGEGAWQGGRHELGPYPVESGAGGPFIRIGPEIVNRMEPYLPFTLSLPQLGLEAALDWPEDIAPAPEGATGGGVSVSSRPAADLSGRVSGAATPAQAAPPPPQAAPQAAEPPPAKTTPPPAPERPTPADAAPTEPSPARPAAPVAETRAEPDARRRSPLPLAAALLALLIGGAALWWFLLGPGAAPEPPPPVVAEPAEATPPVAAETAPPATETETAAACVRDQVAAALRSAEPDLPGLRAMVALCREAGDADLEVRVLEKLAGLGEAEALLDFGRRYDPRETGAPRSFGAPDAANAANYYKRAVEAGSDDAAADLTALCTHLRGAGDAAARMVIAIHCE